MKTKFYGVSGLFLKFFIGFWITILIVAGFAWTLSADRQDAPQNYGSIERGPGVCRAIDVAQGMQRWGGTQAMLNWLRDSTSNTKPEVFVIDAKGREISGRRVPEMALDELRTLDPATFIRGMRGHGHAHRGCGRVGVVVANVGGFGECTFFTVRTDPPPPNPGLKTLWHTPWWVWVVLLASSRRWSQAALPGVRRVPSGVCTGPCSAQPKATWMCALQANLATGAMKSGRSPDSSTKWPSASRDSSTGKSAFSMT